MVHSVHGLLSRPSQEHTPQSASLEVPVPSFVSSAVPEHSSEAPLLLHLLHLNRVPLVALYMDRVKQSSATGSHFLTTIAAIHGPDLEWTGENANNAH